MTTLYGIKNCDTVRKARRWLEQHQIPYQFHDLREDGLTTELLSSWVVQLGWEALLNKRSTSFRQLSETARQVADAETASALMLATPTLIKRPLLVHHQQLHLGFKAETYQRLFLKAE
jgi:Spx/MgsR family transcriptional regulator